MSYGNAVTMAGARMVGAGLVGGAAAPIYPSLHGVRLMELTAQINSNEDAIRWAQRHGFIAGSQTCSRCPGNVAMVLEDCREGDGRRWRCPTQGCRSTRSLRHGSFYTHSKLSLTNSIMVSSRHEWKQRIHTVHTIDREFVTSAKNSHILTNFPKLKKS